jgi:predicted MFS family arabinose efflux permease
MVFGLSAALSVGTALLVTFGSREVRPAVVPEGRVLTLAFGAVWSVLRDPTVRRIFLIFGVSFLANQMSRPYLPVVVEGVAGTGPGLASAIGLVMGTAALVGGLMAPLGGWLGDRFGFRRILVGALALGGTVLALMPVVPCSRSAWRRPPRR